MITMRRTRWRRQVLSALILPWLALWAVACSNAITNNNGNCDAQGGGNGITCIQQGGSSAAGGQAAGSPVSTSTAPSRQSSSGGTGGGGQGGGSAPQTEFLSEKSPVDQDVKADTAYVNEGGYHADGIYYNHAIEMDAGCQNGDGGDMWAEWNLDRSWKYLTGTVALSDGAVTGSDVAYAVYLDGRKAVSGSVAIGQSAQIKLNVTGVYRLRLWMNDPKSPNDECGFSSVPYLVWGNLTANA